MFEAPVFVTVSDLEPKPTADAADVVVTLATRTPEP
jgi:hypothetical protein